MTTYAAVGTTGTLYITPGSFEIRIPQIVLAYEGNMGVDPTTGQPVPGTASGGVYYYSSVLTGGTSAPIVAMRGGSSSSTATVKVPSSVSGGTEIASYFTGGNGAIGGTFTFQPAFDLVISPGETVLLVVTNTGTGSNLATVYFEELRLSWPA